MDRQSADVKNEQLRAGRRFSVLARWTDMPDHLRFRSASPTKG